MSDFNKQPTLFEVFGRTTTPTVPEINEEALDTLTNVLTSSGDDLGKVVLLRSPRAGYGKTLLLQSVSNRLNETFRFLAVEPSGGGRIDGEVVLESVLRQLSEVLPASGGLTEFDLFARKLLAIGLKPLLISGEIPSHDREGALFAIENRPIETFDFHHQQAATAHWTQANFEVLGPRLASELSEISRCTLRGCAYWVDLLFRYATTPPEKVERTRLLTEAVFGDLQGQGSSGAEERLQSLFALLGLVEPVVLVFDETEGLSNQPEAGLRVAAFIVQLRQACPSLTVILSVNEDVWETGLKPLMPGGLEDRLTEYEVSLSALKRSEADTLLESRFGREASLVREAMSWPEPLSARGVLREAALAVRKLSQEAAFVEDEEPPSEPVSRGVMPPPLDSVLSPEVEQRLEPSTAFEAEAIPSGEASPRSKDEDSIPVEPSGEPTFADPFREVAQEEQSSPVEQPALVEEQVAEPERSPFEIVPEGTTSSNEPAENIAAPEVAPEDPFADAGNSDFASSPKVNPGEWSAETAMKQFAAAQPEARPPQESAEASGRPSEVETKSPFDLVEPEVESSPAPAEPRAASVEPSPFQVLKEEKERAEAEVREQMSIPANSAGSSTGEASSPFSVSQPAVPAQPPVEASPPAASSQSDHPGNNSPFSINKSYSSEPSVKMTEEEERMPTTSAASVESPFAAVREERAVEKTADSVNSQALSPTLPDREEPAPQPHSAPPQLPAEERPSFEETSQPAPVSESSSPASAAPARESAFAATSPFAAAPTSAKDVQAPAESASSGQDTSEVEELLSQFKKRFGQPGS
ncbi:hypothetical protein AAFN60_14705 [Roseibacillus persicicus]|uniref:hypothetical protein n=1 Tax=Roseibacillus persicicus TaxID=454148 RepID=UPI00398AF1A5